jgi:diaminopimelate epimerase
MEVHFYKYHGTGNDFIIIDNRLETYSGLTQAQIKLLCNRHFGVGADGLMLLNHSKGYDFGMTYFNANGHEGSMCGNGGRCLVAFAYRMGIAQSTYKFLAIDGVHEASIQSNGWVSLKMNDVSEVESYDGNYVLNTGSPHYVVFEQDVMAVNVKEKGRAIRNSKRFAQEGINVNFVATTGEDGIYVRTYERGVEDETLSCGTGVTAAALLCAHNDVGFNAVRVNTLGGRLLVEFDKVNPQLFKNIYLIGPASFVFQSTININ